MSLEWVGVEFNSCSGTARGRKQGRLKCRVPWSWGQGNNWSAIGGVEGSEGERIMIISVKDVGAI